VLLLLKGNEAKLQLFPDGFGYFINGENKKPRKRCAEFL
jgi:hypothetical protein